jgi:hypothetical protein
MHGSADVFRRNENIRQAGPFRREKRIARRMNRQFPGYQIGLSRQDISVLPDARDLTSAFEVAQSFAQYDSCPSAHTKFPRDLDLVQRPVIFPGQKREKLFPNCGFVYDHFGETICSVLSI